MFKVKEGIELFGNAYLRHPTGNYGSVEIDGGATGSWEGYSIGGRAVFMHNNSTEVGLYNDVNNQWLLRGWFGGSMDLMYAGTTQLQTQNGFVLANNQMRAPIYYDSANTAYYGDFASTSRMNDIYANKLRFDANYGHGVYGKYSSTRLQHLWSMGTSYKLPDDGTTAGNLYGIAWSHPNAGTIGGANQLGSHGMLILQNGVWKGAWGGGSLRTPTDVRAPIFYDLDNTTYYLDPANSGTALKVRGKIILEQGNTTAGGIELNSVKDSTWPFEFTTNDVGNDNPSGFWVGSNGYPDMRLRRENDTVRALISSWERSYTSYGLTDSTDMRAPIFYDNNDTSYYVDPASTSRLNRLQVYKGVEVTPLRDTRGSGDVLFDLTAALEDGAGVSERSGSGAPGSASAVAPTGCPAVGGKAISITSGTNFYSDFIEVEPGEQIYGEVWAKKANSGDTVRFYYGVERFDKNKKPIASNTGCTYFVAANSSLSTSWTKYKGYLDIATSHTSYGGSDGSGVKYIRVRFLGNYQTSGQAYYAGLMLKRVSVKHTLKMHNNDINHVNQLHFNDNVRFYDDGNDNYLNFKWGDSGYGGIRMLDGQGTIHGTLYGDGSGKWGLLDNNGHWAVRVQTGTSPLELRCDNNAEFYVYNSYTYSPGSSRAPIFYDSNNTGYYIDAASTSKLYNLTVAGTLTETSDIRVKSDIERIDNALEKVQQLSGYTFNMEGSDKRKTGVIAQEVEEVLPEAVTGEATKSVAYGNMVGLLIEAIKEQQSQIETLKTEVQSLKENL